jgi:hypothetical protein
MHASCIQKNWPETIYVVAYCRGAFVEERSKDFAAVSSESIVDGTSEVLKQLINQSGVFFLDHGLSLYFFHHFHCPFLPHRSSHELTKLLILSTSLRLALDLLWPLLATAF